jgi:1-deoxy-D-xylulose-5-phosphate synthase
MEENPIKAGALLSKVQYPADLRKLSEDQLDDFCFELRDYIVDVVSKYGGHFGANLGVVELTTALHYVYDTPKDLLVWDVGHQAYGHKIITGRRDRFHTNRKLNGISGFPKRSESEYDTFGVGHSSTSISAALGMAVANQIDGNDNKVVAIIGDGSMTAGMAFEAMNNAGAMNSDVLIILNDNCMSIDPNVGALKEYLTDITTSKTFNRFRDELYDMLGHFKSAGESMRKMASRVEKAVTAAVTPGSLFRALGLKYYGPVDGHDIETLVRVLRDLKDVKGPKILHTVTVKGKGFAPAEREQTKWHASSSPFDKITGESIKSLKPKPTVKKGPKYQDVFGQALVELAEKDESIVAVTPAMPSGSSLWPMMKAFPNRAFDVGIAEQHAVTFAAGMATQGKKAVAAIYSSFLQRAYDQVVHDVCIQKLPVIFCLDRAGLAGADGPTHHGLYDIPFMRCIPNVVVAAPMDEQELRDMMYTATEYSDGAFSIRYPRGESTGMDIRKAFEKLEIGKGRCIREGSQVAILSFGTIGGYVVEATERLAKEGIEVGHYDMRFTKPLDEALIDQILQKYDRIITIEDGTKVGGFGSAVAEYVVQTDYAIPVKIMGVPDEIVEHGTQRELHDLLGIGPDGIINTVKTAIAQIIGVDAI